MLLQSGPYPDLASYEQFLRAVGKALSLRASVVFIKNVGRSQLAVDPNRLFPNLDPNVGIVLEQIGKIEDHRAGPALAGSAFRDRENFPFRLVDPAAQLVWVHVFEGLQIGVRE